MSVAETYENFADGGVILWGTEPPPDHESFLVRLRLKDGEHAWSSAWMNENGDVDYELRYVVDGLMEDAQIVGYCRGPDPNSNVAYQLNGDPGEGMGAKPGEGLGS